MRSFFICLMLIVLTGCSSQKKSYNATLDNFNYPFQVKKFKFNSQNQDLNMAYMDIGNKKSENVIVLLHGKNFSGYYWESLATELMKNDFRVIIPDQIGFGKSTKPRRYQFSFPQFALNTKKLLNHLKINEAIIVGHSMGGMLATTFAYDFPKMTKKLILVNSIGLESYGKYAEFKDTNFFYNLELNKNIDKIRNYQKKNYYDGDWKPEYENLLEAHRGQLIGNDKELVAWNNALTYGPIFSEDITAKFSAVKSPVVIINGTRDKTGPGRGWKKPGVNYKLGQYDKLGKKIVKQFPNAKLFELEGVGHMPFYEAYDDFLKIFMNAL